MIRTYHVTSRDRAAQILAEGFTEDQVVRVAAELQGVRLMDHPGRNTNPTLKFRVTGLAVDGEEIPAWVLHELQQTGAAEDPRDWEPLPVMPIHDPIGMTVLELTFGDDISLDDYRYEEQVKLWNRRTDEQRPTEHFGWAGEWLVPLEIAQRAKVRLLECELEAEDYAALDRWRAHFQAEGWPPERIQQALDQQMEFMRAWTGDEESERE